MLEQASTFICIRGRDKQEQEWRMWYIRHKVIPVIRQVDRDDQMEQYFGLVTLIFVFWRRSSKIPQKMTLKHLLFTLLHFDKFIWTTQTLTAGSQSEIVIVAIDIVKMLSLYNKKITITFITFSDILREKSARFFNTNCIIGAPVTELHLEIVCAIKQ